MANGRKLGVAFSVIVAAIVVACSSSRPEDDELGSASSGLTTDASDAPHDARDAQSCREVTLRAHHERCEHGRHHHGEEDAEAEISLSPPMAFAIPRTIALAEHNPHAPHVVELSFARPSTRREHDREDDDVVCIYASGPLFPAAQATFLFCTDGTRAGAVVTASEVELGVEHDGEATATVTLDEAPPCAASDAGADGGRDGGADGGRDAGADAGVDAGADAGLDAGVDASADGGGGGGTDAGGGCTPASCDDGNLCTTDTCTPQGCTHAPTANGTSCATDNDICNGAETCDGAGHCNAGTPLSCNIANPCVLSGCNPVTGCESTPIAAGTACSDGSACTIADVCDGIGHCVGTPVVLPSSACVVTTCDPVLGIVSSPAPDGTACTLDACAVGTTCSAGLCSGGTALDCTSGNACVIDACDRLLGCTHTPRPAGDTSCSNGNPCDGVEQCNGLGACNPGTAPSLDDHNVCTLDACSAAAGITHTPVPNCDPTPVQGDAPFETRASIFGRVLSSSGGAIAGATFTVYDERATGTPRSDVVTSVGPDGSFKLRLATFPDAEPDRSPPHRLIVAVDSPGTLRAYREGYAHPGTSLDLGDVRLISQDPAITNIGPAGGTASDSQGLVQLVVPAGALATTVPIQITPIRQRQDFPAPLPDATLTMYGFELSPSGTTFATPATVRLANYRNVPTTLQIPVGSFDPVENRWNHEALAIWDGARFSAPISHFSLYDGNPGQLGDLALVITTSPNPNQGAASCGVGSSWRMSGGSIEQGFTLPSTRVRGEDVALTLHYASGLAGSRKLGGAPTSQADASVAPRGSLGVSVSGVKVTTQCMQRGGGGSGGATQPGTCSAVVGSCGLGGGAATSIEGTVRMLAAEIAMERALAARAKDADFGGWVEIPLANPDQPGVTPGQVASTGLVSQQVSVTTNALSACAASGGVFGIGDPNALSMQLDNIESGPYVTANRKVLVHHRFSSPYGAGWAIREVSRVYVDGDFGTLVSGEGQEEEFRPRATITPTPVGLGELALTRDASTGEVFAAIAPGRIARLDPATGAATDVVAGLSFTGGFVHALTVAYVGGARHFVVATSTELMDVDAAGTKRTLAARANIGDNFYNQASVAAIGDVVYYTDGNDALPLLYRARLTLPAPALEPLSAPTGDIRLQPRSPLGAMSFSSPRGLAALGDGSLLVADPRRHVVYDVDPDSTGAISATSTVRMVLGRGSGTYIPNVGDRQPALAYSLNQPSRLAVAEDGIVLVMTSYGITSFDPVAREAELLFMDGGRGEILPSLAGLSGLAPNSPASFVALTSSSMFSRTTRDGLVRVDVERLASLEDPTRILRRVAGGTFELTDTTAAAIWRFDTAGRVIEQRKRTGETDFTVVYADAQSDRITRIVDAVGGAREFGYAGDKLATIQDPGGRITRLTVDDRGDLVKVIEPDGEVEAFTYDSHHMVTKTSPRGDVTSYTYAGDGTVATSIKPGGETYSFEPSLASPPSYDAGGLSIRTGAFTDAHGVRHMFRTDIFGGIDEETYVADGVTRTVSAVHPAMLQSVDEPVISARMNAMQRTSHKTVNGIALSSPLSFDSSGRAVRRARLNAGGGTDRNDLQRWDYAPDGWLSESFSGPANLAQHIDRDAAGHVLRVFDAAPRLGGAFPSGREVSFTWRPDGQPATMTQHGVTTTFSYQDAGSLNLIGSVDTLGRTLSLGYDAYGNVTSTRDGTASASFAFDLQNRLTASRDALGNETTFRYEIVGCGCSERDEVTGVHTPDLPAGVEWTMAYGAQGRLASVTDPDGFAEQYTYEPTGEVKTVTDRLGRTTSMTHDQLGRLLAMVDTLGRVHQRSYSVPTSGATGWTGPTLTAASADATGASTALTTPLRDGDYQLGVNALDGEGRPAQISLYRDATFALGYTSFFDNAQRLTQRKDRTDVALEDTTVTAVGSGAFADELRGYDTRTSLPVVDSSQSQRPASSERSFFTNSFEYDTQVADGFYGPSDPTLTETFTRDVGGRPTALARRFFDGVSVLNVTSTYAYWPDGRVQQIVNADGTHDFTYDARGLLATQVVSDEGTYVYGYDELGRNNALTYPDGHTRAQQFDDLGRISSRCYTYPGPTTRCYSAQYDAVGNPVRLIDPEGIDTIDHDALDRLTKVTREVGGATVAVETYDYNTLGALKVNAGVALDHQRPRLAGAGSADAAVPASLGGQPVTLDAGGRITSLNGTTFTWSPQGIVREAQDPVPALPAKYGVDTQLRRFAKVQGATEYYVNEGSARVAMLDGLGVVVEQYLYETIDHPLRIRIPATATTAYFEVDLAGNVRALRAGGGSSLGEYRYSAFGQTVEDTSAIVQPLRWKGRFFSPVAGGTYDVRARQWSPALGTFLSVDEYVFHDPKGTLWSWPNQNPVTFSDPFGRDGTTDNPIQDLVNSNLLPPGLTIFGKGARIRASGISMMANDATFEAGQAKAACGSAIMAAGAGVVGVDATVLVGVAQFAAGAAGGGGGGGGGGPTGTSRPLTAADLGLKDDAIVQGTFSVRGDKATAYVQYLGAPEGGLGSGLLGSRSALADVARSEGATVLRIETSPIIEITGRLERALGRAGFEGRGNGTMWWEGLL